MLFARWPINRIFYAAEVITVLDKHFMLRFKDGSVKKVRHINCSWILLVPGKVNTNTLHVCGISNYKRGVV